MSTIKKNVLSRALEVIEANIDACQKMVNATNEAKNSDTKSSAGDKHETARAMAQIEFENQSKQLQNALLLKTELEKVKPDATPNKVGFGSLVFTSQLNYFISVGLGKIEVEGELFYCISLASPIGEVLKNAAVGETVSFRNQAIDIKRLV
jgi:transcription elongation GreA/GreB family factor